MAKKYNIKQLTQKDIYGDDEIKSYIGKNGKQEHCHYKKLIENTEIIKIGYCCEPSGTAYPIFIKRNIDNNYKPYFIYKNGMYEVQPEVIEYKDENGAVIKEETDCIITDIEVPVDINFTLDYVIYDN